MAATTNYQVAIKVLTGQVARLSAQSRDYEQELERHATDRVNLRAEVARLTAELADRTDELVASHAIERDLLAVAQDYKTRLAAVEQERNALEAALEMCSAEARDQIIKTPFVNAILRICGDPAAILATVRAKARAEGMRKAATLLLANHPNHPLAGESYDVLRRLADAEEAGRKNRHENQRP